MTQLESCQDITIRQLKRYDLVYLIQAFSFPWTTTEAIAKQWERWFTEHQQGVRTVYVLENQRQFIGYGSLLRNPEYPAFKNNNIPEVHALWIDERFRKQGLATRLIKHLEEVACDEGYEKIGIGVGLYQDYGPAQKLYFKMGYQPDGNGITYNSVRVTPGKPYPVDDGLILWLIKPLK
ncbi:MAG: N-acetyltransferase family protein [Parachlamydiaceae bacterium]